MTAHYGIPVPPPVLARSKVSHKLQSSPQEKLQLYLILFTLCLASLTSLLLLVNVVSPPGRSPTLSDEYHSRGATSAFNRPPSIAADPLSFYWAYYSPYHPAAKFERSTRKGCAVSQVNIVSLSVDRSRCQSASLHHSDPPPSSFNVMVPGTQLPE